MPLLHYLSYGGAVAAFIFVTLSLASGLLWISELIEEHSRHAKAIGQRGIYAIIIAHIVLYLSDSLPLHLILFSIACHVVYLQNFTASWPLVSLTSVTFMASCVLVITDHFLWFFYFARVTQNARLKAHLNYRAAQALDAPGFADIATFFGVCVWLAPLFLFLSLSANDNALPMNLTGPGSVPSTPTTASRPVFIGNRGSLFRRLVDTLPLDYVPRLRSRHKKHESQGILAPPSPNLRPIPSPLSSPGFPGLGRVPSIQHLPPSPFSPPQRTSSEIYRPDSPDVFQDGSASFTMTPPPRRAVSGGGPSLRRSVTNDGRLEMRRVVSSSDREDRFK